MNADVTSRLVSVPAGDIEVHEIGTGIPLLCLHGALVGWELWEPLAPLLAAEGFRVVMPTLPMGAHPHAMRPGTDLTPPGLARLVVDLIDALDLRPATIVSNDTSTAVTQLVLTQHAGAVSRAVLTTGDAFRWFFPPVFRPLQGLGYAPGVLRQVAKGVRVERLRRLPLAFGWLTRVGVSDAVAHAWTAHLIADAGVRRDAAAVLRGINTRHTMAAARALPGVDVPVLLVWGADDRAFPVRLAHRLAALLPDARVEVVPDAATFVSLDAPNALARLISAFVPHGD